MSIEQQLLDAVQGFHTKMDSIATAIHNKIDGVGEKVNTLSIEMAGVKKDVKTATKEITATEKKIETHVGEHDECRKATLREIITSIFGVATTVIAGIILWRATNGN